MCCSDFPEMYPLDRVAEGLILAGFPDESPAQAFDDHRFRCIGSEGFLRHDRACRELDIFFLTKRTEKYMFIVLIPDFEQGD